MTGIRFTIDCFIDEAAYNAVPAATKTAIRDRIRQLKTYAKSLPGESTVKATWHRCNHDTGGSCENEVDI